MTNEHASVNLVAQSFAPGTTVGGVVFTLLDNTGKSLTVQSVQLTRLTYLKALLSATG